MGFQLYVGGRLTSTHNTLDEAQNAALVYPGAQVRVESLSGLVPSQFWYLEGDGTWTLADFPRDEDVRLKT
jgi:hypothetical protein